MKAFYALAIAATIGFSVHSHAARKGDKTVDQMTCQEAQAFADANGYYWKRANNDVVPIYPIVKLDEIRCGVKQTPAPQWEHTVDEKYCILSWYCASRGSRQ